MTATLSAQPGINRTRQAPVGLWGRVCGKGRAGLAVTCAVMALAAPTALQAATLVVNLQDVFTIGALRDAGNTVSFYDIGAQSEVVGLSYDLSVFSNSQSWLSEASIDITDSSISRGIYFSPGVGDDVSGGGAYSGSVSLTDLGLNFRVGADGLLRLEYYEYFDDFAGPDATLNGTLTFTYDTVSAVPELSTWALMISGFGMAGVALRRRQGAHSGSLA